MSDGECIWEVPDGFVIKFYFSQCPPGQVADLTYAFDWNELSPELVYESPWICYYNYHVRAVLPQPVVITAEMSMGFSATTSWPPHEFRGAGVATTGDGVYYGCGSQWFDTDYYERWSQSVESYYWTDIAYCLEGHTVANESLSWGQVRALYR